MTTVSDLDTAALALAERWVATTTSGTARERRAAGRLASLVSDPAGLELALRFVDRVARPEDPGVAAAELRRLGARAGDARFLDPVDRLLLRAGALVAPLAPGIVVPTARLRLRQLVGHLVADAGPSLAGHIRAARDQGFRLNLNLLGEAVLGDAEATGRLRRVEALTTRPDVDYVSVKISAVAAQLSTWDADGSRERVLAALLPLYRTATAHGTFLNLDMEEYRDLAMTVGVFERLCADPGLADAPLGIVLQAYLPDASAALEELTALARARVARGGAPIKVRLVKGANLAMEQVEAELHGWPQAPYPTKALVDAHYVRLLDTALHPDRTAAVRVGVASHNLFHLALAHLLATERGVAESMDVEMLQGMAPAQARAVRDTVAGTVLLYTPVVARADFDVAIAYLVRRLEENATPENFLHAAFAPDGAMPDQRQRFLDSLRGAATLDTSPRRVARPQVDLGPGFANAPDTDPATPEARQWARAIVAGQAPEPPAGTLLRTADDVDAALARAVAVRDAWAGTAARDRAAVLRSVADHLEAARGDLVRAMVHEGSKTVAEADPEVSEAVDFARYYADRAEDLERAGHAVFAPDGITLVTPPWNFPVAIPIGSVLAALAAGSPVVIKPARRTPRCAEVAMAAVHAALAGAGAPLDALQVVRTTDAEVGRLLVSHPDVTRVVLTGSIETARSFASWRDDLDVLAETSGKNAVIVTPSADLDLAVADVVRSAFGHSGQKCSAASLLILVGSAGRSARLRRQLADAVTSLAVAPSDELGSVVVPLVEPAAGKLLRALTELDPGEEWLVRPRRMDAEGRHWSPGVKHGVAQGSFFHTTEVFGPVLGVMHVETLDEAIALQNGVAFGLTGGLHSLDEREIEHWLARVQVGNAYVNRHITGAIVRRQPFGGWKASVVGPGAKAGGPHYVAQLGRWADAPGLAGDTWLPTALADDRATWPAWQAGEDPSGLRAEQDLLRHLPVDALTVRVGRDARPEHVERVLAAARLVGVPALVTSSQADEDDVAFAARVRSGAVTGRIRVVGTVEGLRAAAAPRVGEVTVLDGPVLAAAHRELLTVVREQAISRTRHRFGHVAAAEPGGSVG
jgi:RHH-type proline utilization regulon transcriptional repressor/proline dehydrogenase/delta 1-pyrroline-5-carboxylate dehydrogenase